MNREQTRNAEGGTRNKTDRLRALNVPQRVELELGAHGLPTGMQDAGCEMRRSVEAVGEVWRIDDEWWRQPISRRCVEVVFEQHSSSTTFKNHFDASTRDRLSPPFIVDAPDFADGLNGPTHPASRIPHPDRLSVCVELYCHSMGRIQGTKSVRSVPRSAFRVPRLIRAHNRSTHTAALGAATMAAPR